MQPSLAILGLRANLVGHVTFFFSLDLAILLFKHSNHREAMHKFIYFYLNNTIN